MKTRQIPDQKNPILLDQKRNSLLHKMLMFGSHRTRRGRSLDVASLVVGLGKAPLFLLIFIIELNYPIIDNYFFNWPMVKQSPV